MITLIDIFVLLALVNKLPQCATPKLLTWESHLTEKEVLEEIKKLEVSKSSGFTEIIATLKKVLSLLIAEFTYLLNQCKKLCVFPEAWKDGCANF